MTTSISWDLFETTYLRPQIADIYGSQYDEDTLKKTTYSSISDLVSKGLVDIGPLPASEVIAAIKEISYLTPTIVATGNSFRVTYGTTTVSFVASANSIANVTAGLTSAINNNTTFSNVLIAYDEGTRVRVEGKTAGQALNLYVVAEKLNVNSAIPVMDIIVYQSSEEELEIVDLTVITANHADAFNTIAAGVKYFLVSDPVTKLQTAAGLDIEKNESLISACKANYETLILAYLRIHILNEITASAFWKEKLQVSSTQTSGSSASGQLTLAERLTIIEAEKNAKLAEIAREEDKELSVGDQKRLSSIELKELGRAYELENKASLIEKTATNGAWTSSGQFTISYLVDYQTDLEDTVPLITKDLDSTDFGIPSILDASTYVGGFITVTKYKRLDITLIGSENIGFTLQALNDLTWEDVSPETIDNAITKSYSLINTNVIKIVVRGITPNTELYISGQLHSY
ncbi:hypothetical protein [Nostoc sp.]|uniref:hypothetical protein n=1 Tax=Nostoc sp. TaxID=1180 RepID=UPI002FFD484F